MLNRGVEYQIIEGLDFLHPLKRSPDFDTPLRKGLLAAKM